MNAPTDAAAIDTDARRILKIAYSDCGCRIPPPFDEVAEHAVTLAEAEGFKRGKAYAPDSAAATPVTLVDCPIGLFRHGDELCLKTEYGSNEGRIDAYIVSTGEFFWGPKPQGIASQRACMVTPVDAAWNTRPPTDAAAVREAAASAAITDAIAQTDEAFRYSFNLTRLVDGEETHTLTMPGFEPVDFEDRDEGYALIAERRNRARADAILAAIRQFDLPGGEEVERLRKLSERATPGPWAWEQCGEKEDAPVVGTIFGPDDQPHAGRFEYPIDADEDDYIRFAIFSDCQPNDGHSASANADFAVAAVNYVRGLLALALARVEQSGEGGGA